MKGFVYVLKCSNGKYYTGSTTNLEKRLWQHQNGEGSNFTKAHLPVELVYVEEFERIDDAFYREKQIQGWSRKKKEALIAKDFDLLHELAKSASTGSATEMKNGASTGSATEMKNGASTGSATEMKNGASTDSATEMKNGASTDSATEMKNGASTDSATGVVFGW